MYMYTKDYNALDFFQSIICSSVIAHYKIKIIVSIILNEKLTHFIVINNLFYLCFRNFILENNLNIVKQKVLNIEFDSIRDIIYFKPILFILEAGPLTIMRVIFAIFSRCTSAYLANVTK